jgi:general secretion pathway protein A
MNEDFYGLIARPFQLTPDPRFWFESATHKKAMAYLGYGLAQAEGFIFVTGEIGAGKTTLIGHLLASLDPSRVEAINIATTAVDSENLLLLIAQGIGVVGSGSNKAHLFAQIEDNLSARARSAKKTLIIIDEAQNLPIGALEDLRLVSNFQFGGMAAVQFLILGQPELRDTLALPELEHLRQRVVATHHLTAMSADEVGDYILHRLRLSGWQGRPDFSADALDELFRLSGGIPRKINLLATRVLLMGTVEQSEMIDGRIVAAAAADLAADSIGFDANVEAAVVIAPVMSAPELVEAPTTPELVPEPNPTIDDDRALDLAARVAMLEAQVEEQDAALRRILNFLVDWVEQDTQARQANGRARAPAA